VIPGLVNLVGYLQVEWLGVAEISQDPAVASHQTAFNNSSDITSGPLVFGKNNFLGTIHVGKCHIAKFCRLLNFFGVHCSATGVGGHVWSKIFLENFNGIPVATHLAVLKPHDPFAIVLQK
jgi:hypothetical protein